MKEKESNPYHALDEIGIIGSQDTADQPTAEDVAAIGRFLQALRKGVSPEEARRMVYGKDGSILSEAKIV